MTAAKPRVALIARADGARRELAGYLRSAGFDVDECEKLEVASGFAALVVIGAADEPTDDLVATVRALMKSLRSRPVLVVTSRPTALKELVAAHGERLCVLPAPAFGWDVVDKLRSGQRIRPRGA